MAGSQLQADFSELIRGQLRRSGISQAQFARWLKTTENTVCGVLNGHQGLSFERAERWAAALGIDLKLVGWPTPREENERERTCSCHKS